MALIICLETSSTLCSVALTRDGTVINFREINEGYRHAEMLTLFIQEIIQESAIGYKDLDAVCVGRGPGSFTGLRIGVSTAKGLCFALQIPLLSIPSPAVMKIGATGKCPDAEAYFALIDARRLEVYTALFDKSGKELWPVKAMIMDQEKLPDWNHFSKIVCFGDGAEKCMPYLPQPPFSLLPGIFPSAVFMAKEAYSLYVSGKFELLDDFEPFYLKDFLSGPKINQS